MEGSEQTKRRHTDRGIAELGETISPCSVSAFNFPGMGSSKLIALNPRNQLETQTSAYALGACGGRAKVHTFKVTVYLHSQGAGRTPGGGGGRQGAGLLSWAVVWPVAEALGRRHRKTCTRSVPSGARGHLHGVWWALKAACVWSCESQQRLGHAPVCDTARVGSLGSPDGPLRTRKQSSARLEPRRWQSKGNRWWGHQILSSVPSRLAGERLGEGRALPQRQQHARPCPISISEVPLTTFLPPPK